MNEYNSIFGQVLRIFPRNEFYRAVKGTEAEKGAKGFTCWHQFVAMFFCRLGQAHSLREICGGLASCFVELRHLGIEGAPKHSTLSYANEHRPWQLHLLLDRGGYLPVFAHVTEGRVHEVNVARGLTFTKGSIVVIGGYVDYALFSKWTEDEVYFVTRQKDNADFRVLRGNPVPERGNILRDQIIELEGFYAKQDCPYRLRRIEVWDGRNERVIALLTNHLEFGPTTIAAIYKGRWQVEIFFKTIKQNLKIKTFVGTFPNAVMIQIWTALVAILVLKYLKFRSTFGWSLSNLVAMLRYNLFTYRDLWAWVDSPYEPPPFEPDVEQLSLRVA